MADKQGMDDLEFEGVVAAAIRDAVDYADKDIAVHRADAIDRYLGKPYGDEREGRSKVIATEVRDTIESILPSLMRIFCSAERGVEFVPQGPEDVQIAEQATDYCNWIWQRDNPGFQILQTWLKDGLLCKVGVVKFWWDEAEEVKTSRYSGLTLDEVRILQTDPDAEIVSLEGELDEQAEGEYAAPGTFDVELRRVTKRGRVRIEAVPPEEFLIERNAKAIEDAALVAHRREVTVSDLVAMGYDYDEVSALAGPSDLDTAGEPLARRSEDAIARDNALDPALRKVQYTEAYLRVDKDGDGIAELRRVCTAGPSHTVLHDEPWDDVPFAAWCPVPLPHVFYGLSIADLVSDLQRIKSVIMRQVLDNLVLANHPRMAVVEGQVNIDDVLNDELGAIYRMRAPGMVQPLSVPFVAQQSFPVLEYLDMTKEQRTGISKASMGLDADSLQSTTKAAVSATISAAQGKIEMLARIFAETGLKTLFRGVLKLIVKHQDQARMIRLRNQWVPVDPRSWDAEMDVSVNVGLGNGREEEKMQALMMVKATQEQILLQLGPQNPLVDLGQYRNTLSSLLEIAGYKDAGRFFKDPAQAPPMPPAAHPPDPKMIEVQARAQIEAQKAQAEAQMASVKMQHEQQIAEIRLQNDLTLQRERVSQEIALKREQLNAELQLRQAQMVAEAQLARDATALDHHAKIMKPVEMGGEVG